MGRGVDSEHRVLLLTAFDLAQLHLLLRRNQRCHACAWGLLPLPRALFRRSNFARLQHCAPLALLLAEMPPRIRVLALGLPAPAHGQTHTNPAFTASLQPLQEPSQASAPATAHHGNPPCCAASRGPASNHLSNEHSFKMLHYASALRVRKRLHASTRGGAGGFQDRAQLSSSP